MHWVVGDVQGCAREFDDLVSWIRFDPDRDELWCLGDLVNRGPDSLAVLRLWRDLAARSLLGNHDVYALLAHAGKRSRKGDTLEPLLRASDGDALLERLRREPVLVRLPAADGVAPAWIVHAGLHPGWLDLEVVAARINDAPHDAAWLESADVAFATRVRYCTAAGELGSHSGPPATCPPPFSPWDTFYAGPDRVVHGHWAKRGAYRGRRTMGLDSGCVYGGLLTAWCQQEDRVVQVPARERGGHVLDFPARRLASS